MDSGDRYRVRWRPGDASLTLLGVLLLCSVAPPPRGAAQDTTAVGTSPERGALSGTVDVLSYNVAGLPPGLSRSRPVRNMLLIGPLLNGFDLVLVQEDFYFNPLLALGADHEHRSDPQVSSGILSRDGFRRLSRLSVDDPARFEELLANGQVTNDGLNRFSRFPFSDHRRIAWDRCSGLTDRSSDCLASKGFSVAHHEVAPGVVIHVYNLHADAGRAPEDERTRRAQFRQLARFIRAHSRGRPLIVAGDTNLQSAVQADAATLEEFLEGTGLAVAATRLEQADMVDRVFYRSGARVILRPIAREIPSSFLGPGGTALSDHLPVHVTLRWAEAR